MDSYGFSYEISILFIGMDVVTILYVNRIACISIDLVKNVCKLHVR